jgi:hypothetical protein
MIPEGAEIKMLMVGDFMHFAEPVSVDRWNEGAAVRDAEHYTYLIVTPLHWPVTTQQEEFLLNLARAYFTGAPRS